MSTPRRPTPPAANAFLIVAALLMDLLILFGVLAALVNTRGTHLVEIGIIGAGAAGNLGVLLLAQIPSTLSAKLGPLPTMMSVGGLVLAAVAMGAVEIGKRLEPQEIIVTPRGVRR